MTGADSGYDAANRLREQAASFRRLARRAMTHSGALALQAVADHVDRDARQINPHSERR